MMYRQFYSFKGLQNWNVILIALRKLHFLPLFLIGYSKKYYGPFINDITQTWLIFWSVKWPFNLPIYPPVSEASKVGSKFNWKKKSAHPCIWCQRIYLSVCLSVCDKLWPQLSLYNHCLLFSTEQSTIPWSWTLLLV